MTEITHRRVVRGIPRWLLREYLADLGARPAEPDDGLAEAARDAASTDADSDLLVGEGWRARLTQLDDYRIGSLRSGQVELAVTGASEVVTAVLVRLEPRLFRGGG
jgi:hypothetical protein